MSIVAASRRTFVLSAEAGVGLKPAHYRAILETNPAIGFFEVHAENYMGAGGPPHRWLTAIRERYPLSLHGVGLSIGGAEALDREHLQRLRRLIDRYQPALFSEHLAWSTHETAFFNDLLPLPYTTETLHRVVDHIDETQEALGRTMLLENPSTYLAFAQAEFSETDFIAEVARRTGCGLLLDVNNVRVTSTNQGLDPVAYIDAFPLTHVQEIHLAGFAPDIDEKQRPLLIDAHDRPVDASVWDLYAYAVARLGPAPTLIEWDANVPAWPELHGEALRAERVLAAACRKERADAAVA
ncbi:MNIO family bufferin maturase [Roseiarcus sp.]|uniref:MNIO family bufferin maturase n=1 Tax=Roseiarcus sp. TaxID=1969460 RepID=UPI003F95BB07